MVSAHATGMMNSRNTVSWLFITALSTASVIACGDDDSGNDGTTAGRGGSSQSGSSGLGGDDGTSNGGEDTGSNAGRGNGGSVSGGGAAGGGTAGDESGPAGAGGAMAGAGGGSSTVALTDPQILLVLDTLNQGEVEQAYAALPRLTLPDVEAFAQLMVTHHSAARQSVLATADGLQLNPTPSEVQMELKQEAEAQVTLLRATNTASLDATYMDLQVAAHAEALALLSDLELAADAPELQTLIGTLEATVQDHYDSAVAIEGEL
jgi:putative membrane protein